MQIKRYPVLYKTENECCGCTACQAICPKEAIIFEYNNEGFLYPKVDKNLCVQCQQCENVCAFKTDSKEQPIEDTLIYAVKHKSADVIKCSSSGGLFTALSDYFLNNGNAVASCVYNFEMDSVRLKIYNDKKNRDEARGSKYIQAELGDSFKKIEEWVVKNTGKKLMVVGTGCQIAGLDMYLKKKSLRDRVVLVDLICHGVTSPNLWKAYIHLIKGGGNLEKIAFKDKKYGWHYPRTIAIIDGKEKKINSFSDWFYLGLSIRESCYSCPYTKVNRNSDITIGDYWGIEETNKKFSNPMGVSLALVHSIKGVETFNAIKTDIDWLESDVDSYIQPRLISPECRPSNRDAFWNDMNNFGIEYCAKKYCREDYNSIKNVLMRKVKKVTMELLLR